MEFWEKADCLPTNDLTGRNPWTGDIFGGAELKIAIHEICAMNKRLSSLTDNTKGIEMDLIEYAARELARLCNGHDDWDGLDAKQRELFGYKVRSVLKAVRDPDEHMAEAGAEIIRNVSSAESSAAHRSDAANTWRFMIDILTGDKK